MEACAPEVADQRDRFVGRQVTVAWARDGVLGDGAVTDDMVDGQVEDVGEDLADGVLGQTFVGRVVHDTGDGRVQRCSH